MASSTMQSDSDGNKHIRDWGDKLLERDFKLVIDDEKSAYMKNFNLPRIKIRYPYSYKQCNAKKMNIINACVFAHRLRRPLETIVAHIATCLHASVKVNKSKEIKIYGEFDESVVEATIVSFIQEYIICPQCYHIGLVTFVVHNKAIVRCPNCPHWHEITNVCIAKYYLSCGISCDNMDPTHAPIELQRKTQMSGEYEAQFIMADGARRTQIMKYKRKSMLDLWVFYENYDDMVTFVYHNYDAIKTQTYGNVEQQRIFLDGMWYIGFRHEEINDAFVKALAAVYELNLVDAEDIAHWCIRQCITDESILPFMPKLMETYTMENDDILLS